MDCAGVKERLSEFADGMLPEAEAAAVEEHLAGCTGCAQIYASMSKIIEHMQQMELVEEPADFLQTVNARLETQSIWPGLIKRFFRPVRIKIPLELAGAAVAALFIFMFIGLGQKPHLYEITMLIDAQPDAADTAKTAGGKSETAGQKRGKKGLSLSEIIDLVKGEVISTEYREGTDIRHSMIIEIQADKYQILRQELQKIADIGEPAPESLEAGSEIIRIKIIFQYSVP